ncbi:hypothetical protein J6590_094774 [Homalodisca vitripennis]|nr:hypothetical protein J6590_094774 [Homalodisca vitripennis]
MQSGRMSHCLIKAIGIYRATVQSFQCVAMLIWELPFTEEEAVGFFLSQGLQPVTILCKGGHAMKYFNKQYPFWKCNVRPSKKKVEFRFGTLHLWLLFWSIFNQVQRGTDRHHLDIYLAEYMWWSAVVETGGNRFDALLAAHRSLLG